LFGVILACSIAMALPVTAASAAPAPAPAPAYAGPSNKELDATRLWFWSHPPDGTNRAERLDKMAVIQAAADQLTSLAAEASITGWGRSTKPPKEDHGVLYYLNEAVDRAVKDIHRTRVSHGVVIWYIYNMGYIFKTPDACFGIDLCMPGAKRLVKDLDFFLISHAHMDHHTGGLGPAMVEAGKPVVTSFLPGSTIVKEPSVFHFGPVRVKGDIGDHSPKSPDGRNNMLMYQVDCGPSSGDATIYHSGDGANYEKMTPDRPVDVFIPHVACSGMEVAEAMRHVHPKTTLVSHVMELTHDPKGARWTFAFANDKVKDFPEKEAVILTWGERWALPGTEFTSPNER
jgi:hypothetical protein